MDTGSKRGDVAKVIKEILTAKENGEKQIATFLKRLIIIPLHFIVGVRGKDYDSSILF